MTFPADLTAHALARLPSQYRGGEPDAETNTQKILRILTAPANPLAQAIRDVIAQRNVETATGVWLTQIGSLVGREREGVTDDEIYRRYVKAQISTNKSDGIVEDILTIATLVIGDEDAAPELDNTGAAAFILRIEDVALADDVAAVLIELMITAAAAGVRPILEYSTAAPATVARWTTQGVWGTAVWARAIDKEI